MGLTDTQTVLLRHLETHGRLPQSDPWARSRSGDLLALKADGLVALTPSREAWVITPAGQRALVPVDHKTRLSVEPWRGRNQGGPT